MDHTSFASVSPATVAASAGRPVASSSGARRVAVSESYAWEAAYERTWDAIEEDAATGALVTRVLDRRRRGVASAAPVQRGMLRYVYLVLDLSRGMDVADLKPTRAACAAALAKEFVREYFDQNPISSLGVIVTRHAVAERCSEMSGNPRRHADAIDRALAGGTGGDMSLQTALDIACKSLATLPVYGAREVVLLHGAAATCDPGDIGATLRELSAARVRVSILSLPGEVFVASRIARETGGEYTVPESAEHLRRALLDACRPPPRAAGAGGEAHARAGLVQMGFPTLVFEAPGLCACHKVLRPRGYVCPRCGARACELPTTCTVCHLQLVSAPGLARSYHHLFPVRTFWELPRAGAQMEVASEAAAEEGGAEGGQPAGGARPAAAAGQASGTGSSEGQGRPAAPPAPAGAQSPLGATAAPPKRSRLDKGEARAPEAGGEGGEAACGDDDVSMGVEVPPGAEGSAPKPSAPSSRVFTDTSQVCSGCAGALRADQARFVCPGCLGAFCDPCDVVIHETLFNCPGCCGGQ